MHERPNDRLSDRRGAVDGRSDSWLMAMSAVALACLPGVGCLEKVTVCASGLVCPVGSVCAAEQDVCIHDGCGNGVLDRGEVCDDGNIVSGDGCTPGCRPELAAGGAHGCTLVGPSTLRCWGLGAQGQLGRSDLVSIGDDEPGLGEGVHLGGEAIQLAAGDRHTCALMEAGKVRCWGAGYDGRLGYGNETTIGDDEHPLRAGDVNVGGAVRDLVAGYDHTCALMSTGNVRCWGSYHHHLGYPVRPEDNSFVGDDEDPASVGDVDIGEPVIQLVAGYDHTCALIETGDVRCWGSCSDGCLGYGNGNDIGDDETPSSAGNLDIGGEVVQLAAGAYHTCALLKTGRVRCWGSGDRGRLGYGNTNAIGDDEVPSSAGDVNLGDGEITQLVAGEHHTCALLEPGLVRCWGGSSSGQLGYGNNADIGDNEHPSSVGYVPLGGMVRRLSAGSHHTCALMETGTVRCWGSGFKGRLGYRSEDDVGDDELASSVGEVAVGGTVREVTAGSSHTCVLLDSGAVRCWGRGRHGQLGYATITTIGDDETPGSRFGVELGGVITQVAAGRAHTCALRRAGAVHCWGDGAAGQLGLGQPIAFEATRGASLVVGGTARQIAAGDDHSCVLLETGDVVCWGRGDSGQLGNGQSANVGDNEHPGAAGTVDLGEAAVQVQAGAQHTCALLESGTMRCWGSNEHGQLGMGAPGVMKVGDDEPPAMVGDIHVGGLVRQIAVGQFHSCALLESGDVRCWGRNDAGQLGLASTETVGDDEEPGQVAVIELGGTAKQVTAGDAHTCALLDGGAVRCWGAGDDGRLGYGASETIGDDEDPARAGEVELGGPALAIAAGGAHTCAMLEDGAIVCWGSGADGRLGHGNLESVGDDEPPATVGPVPGL